MPAGQPMDPRAPERPTVAGLDRELKRTAASLDRRIPSGGGPEAVVKFIGPDQPPNRRGRMWLEPQPPGGWPDA